MMWHETLDSPMGPLHLISSATHLLALDFGDPQERLFPLLSKRFDPLELGQRDSPGHFAQVLAAYLGGELGAIDALPTDPGGSAFQQRVWGALREIPAGKTSSYGELARKLGMEPGASRAVGLANGANPVSIVVPCHRVIGADGTLTGYAGGLSRKRWLLRHEGAMPPENMDLFEVF